MISTFLGQPICCFKRLVGNPPLKID